MGTTESPEETFGQRIKAIREKYQLTQDKFGASLGVSRQTVSRWEKEKVVPELANLMEICRKYDITMAYLLGQEEEEELEENPKVWDDERKLRRILLSSAIVVAVVVGMTWIPLLGLFLGLGGLIFSRKWKINSKWLDCVVTIYMLWDMYNICIYLSHLIFDLSYSTFL